MSDDESEILRAIAHVDRGNPTPAIAILAKFGKRDSQVISARVTHAQADAVRKRAARLRSTPSKYLRWLSAGVAREDEHSIREIAAVLGLEPDVPHEQIREAIAALLERVGEPQ